LGRNAQTGIRSGLERFQPRLFARVGQCFWANAFLVGLAAESSGRLDVLWTELRIGLPHVAGQKAIRRQRTKESLEIARAAKGRQDESGGLARFT
jgi:hypothetical protein